MFDSVMKMVIKKVLATSAQFLLGGAVMTAAHACEPQTGSDSVEQAQTLLQQNKSRQAYAYLNLGRDHGEGEAYRATAEMYEQGRGVKPNEMMAHYMNWMGAQNGNLDAMYKTAVDFYARGQRKDGEFWARRAEACGHKDSLLLLLLNAISEGRNADARAFLEKGIDRGYPEAQLALAEVYDKGSLGFPKNPQRAFNWYYMAAKAGNAKAMSAVAYYFVRGLHGVEDDVAAVHWYFMAAKAGHVESMTAYAWMIMNGKGGQTNLEEARYYFKKAAKSGDKQAVAFLASSFSH